MKSHTAGFVALAIVLGTLFNLLTAGNLGTIDSHTGWIYLLVLLGGAATAFFGWLVVVVLSSQPRTGGNSCAFLVAMILTCGGIVGIGFARVFILWGANVYPDNVLDPLIWMASGIMIAWIMLVSNFAYRSKQPSRARLPDDEMYEDSEVYRTPLVSLSPLIKQKLKVGADGELVEVAQSSEQGEIVLSGVGNQVTQVVYLDVGRYQIEYHFNTEQFCDTVLVSVDDVEIANLLVVRDGGHGSKTFAVQFSGRYTFEVQCPFAGVTWNFRCRLL